jgi:RNA polymerase sigma-70 factor (ECF subfamily)
MAAVRPSAKTTATANVRADGQPQDWPKALRSGGQEGVAARALLHELLLAVARDEARRRWPEQAGPADRRDLTARHTAQETRVETGHSDLADLADLATGAAVGTISGELDRYRAHTRFLTWAYKYVMFGLSDAAGRQFWAAQPQGARLQGAQPPSSVYDWKLLASRRPSNMPGSGREWREALAVVRRAVDLELTEHQRAVFAAVTVGDLPPEALTAGLGSDRSAIYRALFEARRRVAARLTADGLLQDRDPPWPTARQFGWLRPLLAADPGDTGCDVAFQVLDRYAEAELAGSDPRPRFPGLAAHLSGCRPCGQDYQGLLAAAARSEPERPEPAGPGPTAPDPTGADPTAPDPTGADPTGADPAGADPAAVAPPA